METLASHYAPLLLQRRQQKAEAEQKPDAERPRQWKTIDLKSIEHKGVRTIGAEHVGWQYFWKLKMAEVLEMAVLSEQQVLVAALLIIGRQQAGRARQLAGDSLVGPTPELWEHKEAIEEGLRGRERELFELTERIVLYDLTNTYFKGSRGEGELIRHGKSKDKRHDRPLITLGLVIDEWGFAKRC